ncbi:hypothetical protein A5777_07135 [Gordonia sp. 852002-10350_SCH5691597]|nr:hypothetical protein A5777_07135 [Gordonia sp. 852002-10350_SCH5691597]
MAWRTTLSADRRRHHEHVAPAEGQHCARRKPREASSVRATVHGEERSGAARQAAGPGFGITGSAAIHTFDHVFENFLDVVRIVG